MDVRQNREYSELEKFPAAKNYPVRITILHLISK